MGEECPYRNLDETASGDAWRCNVHPNKKQVIGENPVCFSSEYVNCKWYRKGGKQIKEIWWDNTTGELVFDIE